MLYVTDAASARATNVVALTAFFMLFLLSGKIKNGLLMGGGKRTLKRYTEAMKNQV